MPSSTLVRALICSLALGLAACTPDLTRRAIPPPASGPLRTVGGDPTHPVCGPPRRPATEGPSPRCVLSFGRSPTAMGVSPDGSTLVVSIMDVQPTAWRLPAVTFLCELAPPAPEPGADPHAEVEAPQAIALSPDGSTVLLAAGDEILRYEIASGRQVGMTEGPHDLGMVDDVVPSRDGSRLLIASAGDGKARLLDAATGRVLRTLDVAGRVVELTMDEAAGRTAVGTEVGTVGIADLAGGAKPRVLTLSTQEITGLRFVGAELVTGARDGHLRILDGGSGKRLVDATVAANITKLAVSADGRLAAAADDQHVVRILALPQGTVQATFHWHQASITALGWSGRTLIVADNDGDLAAWDVP